MHVEIKALSWDTAYCGFLAFWHVPLKAMNANGALKYWKIKTDVMGKVESQ